MHQKGFTTFSLHERGFTTTSSHSRGFTLLELLIVMAIFGILAAITITSLNPTQFLTKSQYAKAKLELSEIGKAAKLYGEANGSYPADVNRNIPSVFQPYFAYSNGQWPQGPFPGSVYDWDNWEGQTCWEGTTGDIQITLRQISNLNVIPGAEWTMFYILKGKGVPHCSTASTQGECINCAVIYGARKQI